MPGRLRTPPWLLLVPLVALACGEAPGEESASAPALTEEETRALEAELVAADRAFARSVARSGLGGWLGAFSPTGRMIAGGESFVGPEGVRRAMLPAFADSTFSITWDPTYAEVASSGDMGYTVGRYETRRGEGDAAEVEAGTYLTVWRRQPDGVWKVQADIGNAAAADRAGP